MLPRLRPTLLPVSAVGLLTAPAMPAAAAAGVTVELNKLEAQGEDCRAYLVFENATADAFTSLKLDLVLFDSDGIIARRLAIEGGPLPAGRPISRPRSTASATPSSTTGKAR